MIVFLMGSILWSKQIDANYSHWHEEKLLYIPKGDIMKHFVFGFNQLAADLLWFKAIAYFGEHALSDRHYPWLVNLVETVTALDPHWAFPYHFAGIILSTQANMVDEANHIVKRGMEDHPDVWQLPFYIGFNFFHFRALADND